MKKLMFAAAVMAAGAAMAVESSIVGYTTQAVGANKYAMIGVQFEGISNSDGEIAINDFITGDFAATDYDDQDEFLDTATEIQVWEGSGYTHYYYLNAHGDYATGWCDDWGDYTEDTLLPGTAVWFWAKTGACNVTTPGQVFSEDDTEITCKEAKYTMVANFMPVELDLNNSDQVTFDGLIGTDYDDMDEFLETASEIQLWEGSGYTHYYYLNAHSDYATGWCDDWGDYLTDTIPVGRGFWAWAKTGTYKFCFKK